jgi:thiol-disulfide isomerase/thioredoxin
VRRWRAPALTGIALVLVLVAAEAVTSHSGGAADSARAPALPGEVLEGQRATVGSLQGKPAAINFWASWCPPCQHEAAGIEKLSMSLGDRAHIVGVNWNDTSSGAQSFIHRYGWTFPNLRDATGNVGDNYGIQGLPTTVVLDSSGRIYTTLRGPQTPQKIDAALRAASND